MRVVWDWLTKLGLLIGVNWGHIWPPHPHFISATNRGVQCTNKTGKRWIGQIYYFIGSELKPACSVSLLTHEAALLGFLQMGAKETLCQNKRTILTVHIVVFFVKQLIKGINYFNVEHNCLIKTWQVIRTSSIQYLNNTTRNNN